MDPLYTGIAMSALAFGLWMYLVAGWWINRK